MRWTGLVWRFVATGLLGALLAGCIGASVQAATPGAPIAQDELATRAARFAEPLVPATPTTAAEDAALLAAITRYQDGGTVDDFSALEGYLADHPQSGWNTALLTDLGLLYYHYGYFSKAIDAYAQAWTDGKSATETHATAVADRAAGELLFMHARLGHVATLQTLLGGLGGRGLTGPSTELLAGAKAGLWTMQNDPGVAFLCGPQALKNLFLAVGVPAKNAGFLDAVRSSPQGTTLAQLGQLADQAQFSARAIYRPPGAPVPVPSVVHWKVNHFAAIIGSSNGRYEVMDPTFGTPTMWITPKALETESSGYFLVPAAQTSPQWRDVTPAEAAGIYGMGNTSTSQMSDTTKGSLGAQQDAQHCGMCGYSFTEMLVSLNLNDTPVGYMPPIGPPVMTTITYNQREASQPSNFSFFNVSQKWTLNWLTYIQDDPTTPTATITRYAAGGGSVAYAYNTTTKSYAPDQYDGSVVSAVSGGYQRLLPDGGKEIYSVSNGAKTNPRLIFLSKIIDAAGNSLTFTYDSKLRLVSLLDATGRTTMLSYGNTANPLLVTAITDPFGRSAKLAYDSTGRLSQITDVLGLTSKFAYDSNSEVNTLTTPYGVTRFVYGDNGNSRFLQATDPLGYTERLEYVQGAPGVADSEAAAPAGLTNPVNSYLSDRDTFYWDKHAYAVAKGNYTKARIRHWAHQSGASVSTTSDTLESEKYPLESRTWYSYPGQANGYLSGTLNKPTQIARLLDDGSTQFTALQYNGLANPTSTIDPVGRTTTLQYAANMVDVTAIQQTTASGAATIAGYTYNTQHQPLTYTDAAGQTTHYAYNAAGQIATVTDALGEVTRFTYDPLGYLLSITNANGKTAASFTYDSFGRVLTRTDSEGWTVTYAYDSFDRVTQETYPDGTTRVYTYSNLDLASVKDRQGRVTTYKHDAVRNLISVTDPLSHVTAFGYYENSKLHTLTDPNGNVTTWTVDLESRVTGKTYADGRTFATVYENTTSRLHAVTDPLGQTKQYAYAADDRPTGVQYVKAVHATASVGFTYDAYFPRVSSMTDGSGATAYAYGAIGAVGALKLASETPPFANATIAYQYDKLGRVLSRSVGGNAETVVYDAIGRVTTHTSDLGKFQRLYVGQTGQLTSQSSGLVGTRWQYDTNQNDRRLTQIVNSPVASAFTYKTTPEYDFQSITEAVGGQTWTYTYDLADRLTKAASSLGSTYQYTYDAASNLGTIQTPSGTTTVVSNKLNQVATEGGSAFTYDANGNLLSDKTRTYTWDAENRLIGIGYIGKSGVTTTLRYDGMSRRIAIVENSGGSTAETRYAWCGGTLCQARSVSDTVSRRYFTEGEEVTTGSSLLYYGSDQQGSVRDVILAKNGLRQAHYDYAPYGSVTTTEGSGQTTTDFRYAGTFAHQMSGLYLTQYRAFDPLVGRWLSRDPIGEAGGSNLYGYVEEEPVSNLDPAGLEDKTEPPELPNPSDLKEGVQRIKTGYLICKYGRTIPGWPKFAVVGFGVLYGSVGAGQIAIYGHSVYELNKYLDQQNQGPNVTVPVSYGPPDPFSDSDSNAPFSSANPNTPFGPANPNTPFGTNNPNTPFGSANPNTPFGPANNNPVTVINPY